MGVDMICNFCGAKVPDEAKFCNKCGNKIETKNGQKTIIIIGLSVVLVVLIGISIYIFTLKKIPASNEASGVLDYDSQNETEDNIENLEETGVDNDDVSETTEIFAEEIHEKVDNNNLHTYEVITGDVTWQEAYDDAIARGGYLARINTYNEYKAIVDLIGTDYGKYHLYVGSNRHEGDKEYYWVDTDGTYFYTLINESSSWYDSIWYDNEPSFSDGDLDIVENTLSLFKVSGKWWLNDTTDDFNANYGNQYSGLIGYIVEYE